MAEDTKDPKDLLKTLGRDDAYLELNEDDMSVLFEACRLGTPFPVKMLVVKSARLELSDPEDVKCFQLVVAKLLDEKGTEMFDTPQRGVHIIREIFKAGIKSLANKV